MKKRNLDVLRINKKSISNLSKQLTGGIASESYGGATCYVCPTYAADRPGCPSFSCFKPQEL